MKQNGTPVQKPPRRVLIAMKHKFKQELDSMEALGIISRYDGHDVSPEWLNSFVITKKLSGALCICLDPTDLNKEIISPVCNTQTMDDVIHKLQHAKYFAIFDTSKGFFSHSFRPRIQIVDSDALFIWHLCLQCLSYGTQQCNRSL